MGPRQPRCVSAPFYVGSNRFYANEKALERSILPRFVGRRNVAEPLKFDDDDDVDDYDDDDYDVEVDDDFYEVDYVFLVIDVL